jgi:hypothetical protein
MAKDSIGERKTPVPEVRQVPDGPFVTGATFVSYPAK